MSAGACSSCCWVAPTLEQADPGQHHHAGHGAPQATGVICGVRVYGYEPAEATALADVRTVYGFHLCGIAEDAAGL
jgi:hypothetical protein